MSLVTYVSAAVLILTYALIISKKVDRVLAALLGGCVMVALGIALGVLPYEDVVGFVDLQVIGIVIGMFLVTEVINESGLFQYIAVRILKASGAEPSKIFVYLCLLAVLVSAVLADIVAILIIGSLTLVLTKTLELDPRPYLIADCIFANTGGLMTAVSAVPNILVATAAGISYHSFLMISLPILLPLILTTIVLLRVFTHVKPLSEEEQTVLSSRIEALDEWGL